MKPLKIGIVGGSLGGLFAAILLQNDGHDVMVFERSTRGLAGRGAGLVGQGDLFHVLRAIGCEHVARIGVVAKERIYFDRNGNITERHATPQTQISWDHLYSTVASRLRSDSFFVASSISCVTENQDGADLVFSDGRIERFDLVIGADGIASVVRPAVNSDARNRFAGYVAWRGLIPEDNLPDLASTLLNRFAFYVTKGVHALGYLVPGPAGETEPGSRRYNWVWYRPMAVSDLADTFIGGSGRQYDYSLPKGELTAERIARLQQDALSLLPPQLASVIAAEPSPFMQGVFDYQANAMVTKRVALMGDAAFVVRPHTAMGVAKAAGDALALRRALSGENQLEEALISYEGERLAVGNDIAIYGQRLGEMAL